MIESQVANIATLIGDQARTRMLIALMGGKALTASELALEADVTAATASSHLTKLVNAQLLAVRKQGRHKYFQLRDENVAEVIEKLLNLSAATLSSTIVTGPKDPDLRKARVCYDHLAGELGVGVYDSIVKNGFVMEQGESTLTKSGEIFFRKLGVDLDKLKNNKRPVCKPCLDWSERRNHLAGSLGKWVLHDIFARNWATKDLNSRSLHFTSSGLKQFQKRYLSS